MTTYALDVKRRWKALSPGERGPKTHLVQLVTKYAFLFSDVDDAIAQAVEEEKGGRRGPKPKPIDLTAPRVPAGPGEQKCSICPGAVLKGHKRCPYHVNENRMRARLWYQSHKRVKADRDGACFDCNEMPAPGRSRCERHLEASRVRMRKRAQSKRDRSTSSEDLA